MHVPDGKMYEDTVRGKLRQRDMQRKQQLQLSAAVWVTRLPVALYHVAQELEIPLATQAGDTAT